MLLAEREPTRLQGQRILERFAAHVDRELASVAGSGLASSHYWAGDLRSALHWARHTVANFPMTTAAVWCAALLVELYRALGMRRERFDAERARLLMMKRIALKGDRVDDRIYALNELMKELESRDLDDDARQCAEELKDLLEERGVRPIPFP
jgi:hypothetical protein